MEISLFGHTNKKQKTWSHVSPVGPCYRERQMSYSSCALTQCCVIAQIRPLVFLARLITWTDIQMMERAAVARTGIKMYPYQCIYWDKLYESLYCLLASGSGGSPGFVPVVPVAILPSLGRAPALERLVITSAARSMRNNTCLLILTTGCFILSPSIIRPKCVPAFGAGK